MGCLPVYDVFADLSETGLDPDALAEHVEALQHQNGFAHSAGRLTVALPRDFSECAAAAQQAPGIAPTAALSCAVADATARRQHLVVILGGLLVSNEAVPPLLDALQVDALFGSAQPRFADAATDGVWPLPPAAGLDTGARQTSRAGLPRLLETLLTAEMLAACMVIRREVVSAMEPADGFTSVSGALAHALCQARRRGFRNIVANRVVVASTLAPAEAYPAPPPADAARLLELYPDAARAASENERQPLRRLEPLLSAAYPGLGARRRLLLDCRGLGARHSGTSQCMLGMLDGFAALKPPWEIAVLAGEAEAEFHGLASRYRGFRHMIDQVSGCHAAILTLNQPWTIERIVELHRHGFIIGFNMLDTIAWDVIYPAPEHLQPVWRFLARHADLLTYISGFTQGQFRRRFPVAPGVTEAVVHLSLLAGEHTLERFQGARLDDHILLFGNEYDHKGIVPAIRLLAASFPLQRIVVLGGREPVAPNVRVVPSGELSAEQVHRLVATARAVVYPSFYEGFGFPVVEGLAYGRPVLVRRSPLWTEIAQHSRFAGKLIEFEDGAALVKKLGQLLSGSTPCGLPSGTALAEAQPPTGWRDAAASMLTVVEERLARGGTRHWLERDDALRWTGL